MSFLPGFAELDDTMRRETGEERVEGDNRLREEGGFGKLRKGEVALLKSSFSPFPNVTV